MEKMNENVNVNEVTTEETTKCPWYNEEYGCFLCPCSGMCAEEER